MNADTEASAAHINNLDNKIGSVGAVAAIVLRQAEYRHLSTLLLLWSKNANRALFAVMEDELVQLKAKARKETMLATVLTNWKNRGQGATKRALFNQMYVNYNTSLVQVLEPSRVHPPADSVSVAVLLERVRQEKGIEFSATTAARVLLTYWVASC